MLKIATERLGRAIERGVLGHVHGERRLAHRRPAGDDHEVPGAQAPRDLVKIVKPGRKPAQRIRIADARRRSGR